jgi:hypothetical protein
VRGRDYSSFFKALPHQAKMKRQIHGMEATQRMRRSECGPTAEDPAPRIFGAGAGLDPVDVACSRPMNPIGRDARL